MSILRGGGVETGGLTASHDLVMLQSKVWRQQKASQLKTITAGWRENKATNNSSVSCVGVSNSVHKGLLRVRGLIPAKQKLRSDDCTDGIRCTSCSCTHTGPVQIRLETLHFVMQNSQDGNKYSGGWGEM